MKTISKKNKRVLVPTPFGEKRVSLFNKYGVHICDEYNY
jgi:hypothetical protein